MRPQQHRQASAPQAHRQVGARSGKDQGEPPVDTGSCMKPCREVPPAWLCNRNNSSSPRNVRVNHSRGPEDSLLPSTPLCSAVPRGCTYHGQAPYCTGQRELGHQQPNRKWAFCPEAKFTLAPQPESEQLATQHKGAHRVVTICRGRAALPSPYCLAPGPPCPGLVQLSMRSALNEQSWVPRSSQVSVSIR